MDNDPPALPEQWRTVAFDVTGRQLDVVFVREDRAAYVLLARSNLEDRAPDFLTECRQFVADPRSSVDAGAYVTSEVALARAIPEAIDYAREYMRRFNDGEGLERCLGSDGWREFQQFYVTDSPIPEDLDSSTLVTLINEDNPMESLSGDQIADDAELETYDPEVEETPDLVLDINVYPRHRDDVWSVADDEHPYQAPPIDQFDRRFPFIGPDDEAGSDDSGLSQ